MEKPRQRKAKNKPDPVEELLPQSRVDQWGVHHRAVFHQELNRIAAKLADLKAKIFRK